MNKEYNVVQIDRYFSDERMILFNNRLQRLRSEGWQQFGEPVFDINHERISLIMWREIPNTNGPYR